MPSAFDCPEDSSGGAAPTFPASGAGSLPAFCCACIPAPDYVSSPLRRLCPSTNLAAAAYASAAASAAGPAPAAEILLDARPSAQVDLLAAGAAGALLAVDPERPWAYGEYLVLELALGAATPASNATAPASSTAPAKSATRTAPATTAAATSHSNSSAPASPGAGAEGRKKK